MSNKCCWQGCDVAFAPILSSFDDGEKLITICPNHAAEYVYRVSENEETKVVPLPSETHQAAAACDACGESENTVLYRTINYMAENLEINLCRTHLHRLFARQLEPEAFLAIAKKHGIFHEIHDDFYDPESGIAFQPMDIKV